MAETKITIETKAIKYMRYCARTVHSRVTATSALLIPEAMPEKDINLIKLPFWYEQGRAIFQTCSQGHTQIRPKVIASSGTTNKTEAEGPTPLSGAVVVTTAGH